MQWKTDRFVMFNDILIERAGAALVAAFLRIDKRGAGEIVSRFWRAQIGPGRAKFQLLRAKFQLFRDIWGVFLSQLAAETAISGWK
jgi:hypothetical protein